jgi:uracil-DNA glycosylase family 4
VREVGACTACSSVRYTHLLGPANGNPDADVMFVGEAPGRFGAGRTGVPFSGDVSGRRFEAFLTVAGLRREDVFVTNALLCNPVDSLGRNRRPLLSEVRRCLPFLHDQLIAVNPGVVVALGEVALHSLALIGPHGASLRTHRGEAVPWFGRTLVPLYHPGRRSTVHRRDDDQRADWLGLRALLHQGGGILNETPRPLSGATGVRHARK